MSVCVCFFTNHDVFQDSSENPEDQNNEMEIESFVQTTEEEKDPSLILAEKFHKRKGIPRRAPFC